MQQIENLSELGLEEQRRVNTVIETLATLGNHAENIAEVAHDVRNMVTALDLYCDLLQQPGVLARPFSHYGGELRLVAAASRRLVDKLTGLNSADTSGDPKLVPEDGASTIASGIRQERRSKRWENIPSGRSRIWRMRFLPTAIFWRPWLDQLLPSQSTYKAGACRFG